MQASSEDELPTIFPYYESDVDSLHGRGARRQALLRLIQALEMPGMDFQGYTLARCLRRYTTVNTVIMMTSLPSSALSITMPCLMALEPS